MIPRPQVPVPRLLSAGLLLTLITTLAAAPPASEPSAKREPGDDKISRAISRGVEIILDRQENFDKKAGHTEWPYEGVYRVRSRGEDGRLKAVIPIGYRIGGTSICGWALMEAPGLKEDKRRQKAIDQAIQFVLDRLQDEKMTGDFESGYDVRGWGRIYALQWLARMKELKLVPPARAEAIDKAITSLVKLLEKSEIAKTGGWNYSRRGFRAEPSTFMTASAVQALLTAKRIGVEIDKNVVKRALDSMEAARLDTSAYQYSTSPRNKSGRGFEAVPGAIGRMAICESTLLMAGRGEPKRLKGSIDAFFKHWEWLEKRRKKTGTHIPPYMIAPYYFYFAHFYTAQAIELLAEKDRPQYRKQLDALLFKVREKSGGWNDRVFDRSENYGTAMVILALLEARSK